jgi:hypothetical protein
MDSSILYCSGACKKNYYIYHALLLLCEDNYSSLSCFKTIHNLFYYLFSNISEHKRNEIIKLWMDTLQKKKIDDEYYYKITYNWIKSITQKDHIGYAAYASKADLISKIVKPFINGKGSYVDYGAGDCKFAKDMGTLLNLKPYSIKVPNGHVVQTPQTALCQEIGMITTTDLKIPKDTRVLVFNFALHHLDTIDVVKEKIQEAYAKLPINALMVIYDHNSDNDIWWNLMHILIEIKSFKETLPELLKFMKNYTIRYRSSYFNQSNITKWCKKVGFSFKKHIQKPSQTTDVCDKTISLSNTMVLCFKKQLKSRRVTDTILT